jgi:CHASE3 domain sensor protein
MKNKSILSTTCQKFMNLFKGIDFNVVTSSPKKTNDEVLEDSISHLTKMLNRAKKELARAQKSYRAGKMSKEELFDYDYRVHEIQEEIRKVNEDLLDDEELL